LSEIERGGWGLGRKKGSKMGGFKREKIL